MNKLIIVASTVLLCVASLSAKELNIERLERNLQTRVSEDYIGVGLVVGIVDGEQSTIISVGKADKNSNKAVTKESLFEIGSISKTFTGLLLADMVIEGELKLDDAVVNYLPEGVRMPTRNGKQISLLHLATHTSGLPRIPTPFAPKDVTNPYADYTVDMMYEFLSNYQLPRDIGETAEYSNLGVGLLGHVLALKAGMDYESLIKERILKPLGMNNTTVTLSNEQQNQFTVGHDIMGNPTSHWDIPTLAGAGGLRSSAEDMMKYLVANMQVRETLLLAAIKLSQKPRNKFGVDTESVGLNWLIEHEPSGDVIWHNGGTGGYRSFIGFDKKTGVGVVVLANSNDSSDAIGRAILGNQIEDIEVVLPKEVSLSKNELVAFIGEYRLTPDFILTIIERNGKLFVGATGQPQLPIFAKSKNEFFYKAIDASLTFEVNENGKVDSLILHQNGDHPAEKIK